MQKKLKVKLLIFSLVSICLAFSAVKSVVSVDSNKSDTYSWPMYQNDLRHSGYSSSPGPLGNETLWKFVTNDTFWIAPTIADGILYAGSDQYGSIYALNVSAGTLIWRYTTPGPISSSPAVVDGLLFVGYVGGFCALNASNGWFLWNFATPYQSTYTSPAVLDGVVYTCGSDGNIYAFDASTGSKIWAFNTNGTILSAPALDNHLLIVSSSPLNWAINSNVYALSASTGSLVWNFTSKSEFHESPTIADDMVFVGSQDGYLYALNETTGEKLWGYAAKLWSYDGYGYTLGGYVGSAAIANGRVYFAAENENSSRFTNIYALDEATGAKIWVYQMGGFINTAVVVAGDEVFLTGNDRYIYALNAETGCEIWKYMTGSGIMSSPSIANDTIFVGSDDGGMYAISGEFLAYAPNPTAKPTATPGPTPTSSPMPTRSPLSTPSSSPSSTPSPTPPAYVGFEVSGNITASQMSDVSLLTNQTTTKISFTVTGESGTFGFSNITIAKSRIPQATTPIIYADGTIVPDQGFTQDANNYYVWYTVHFSTHQILIEFTDNDTAVSPQPTNQTSGSPGQMSLQPVIYGLIIAFSIVTVVSLVLKLALHEKKKT
jgi:outer membrane protein assembly factor BamB